MRAFASRPVDSPAAGRNMCPLISNPMTTVMNNTNDPQAITDTLLRYHRKNPLRVAFGTAALLAKHGGDSIEQAYQHLESEKLVEPVYHKVVRDGASRSSYRITKKGLAEENGS